MRLIALTLVLAFSAVAQESKPAPGKVDEADLKNPVSDLRANKDENKRFFLIGPAKETKAPKDGYRLLVVLPGGAGGPDFLGFVRNIKEEVLDETWLVAQLVA